MIKHITRLWKNLSDQGQPAMQEEKEHQPIPTRSGPVIPSSDVACRYAHNALLAGRADKVEVVIADRDEAEVFTIALRNGRPVLV